MIVASAGKKPKIHPSAYVAPNATVSGDVTIGEGCAVLYGAVLTAEGAPLEIGARTVVMENAVLKSSGGKAMRFPLRVGDECILGPGAYLVGCTVESGAFIAAGAKVFNGAVVGSGVSVALGGIVHVGTRIPAGGHVAMQHIAFGDPAVIYPPERAEEVHARLRFFEDVFNLEASDDVRARAAKAYAAFLRSFHATDTPLASAGRSGSAPKPRRSGEKPPPAQVADVEGVVDAMMLELREMERRREEALRKRRRDP